MKCNDIIKQNVHANDSLISFGSINRQIDFFTFLINYSDSKLTFEAKKLKFFKTETEKPNTVKLGYNELGYDELGYNEHPNYNEQNECNWLVSVIFREIFLYYNEQSPVITNKMCPK